MAPLDEHKSLMGNSYPARVKVWWERSQSSVNEYCDLKFILSMMLMDGNIPDINGTDVISVTSTLAVVPQTAASQCWSGQPGDGELLGDGWDAARSLHDETHLHVGEAVLFSLGTPLVCRGHVQVEAQWHRLLPQFGIPSEERALPLFDHLVNLLCPGWKEVRSRGNKGWLWYIMNARIKVMCYQVI